MLRSSCLCGGIVWEIAGPLGLISHCHCGMCRKSHGCGYATWAAGPGESFRWLQGEDLVARYRSSAAAERCFCSRCGSVVPARSAGDRHCFVPLGNLDDDPGGRPQAHIFVASKASWDEIADELPQFDEFPPAWQAPSIEDGHETPPAREGAKKGALRGSCLCGKVVFELFGQLQGIVKCHCSRCRKSRSAAHGANLFVTHPRLDWISGHQLVDRYHPPDAESFTVCFCRVCGALVPRELRQGHLLGVPAGSLDTDPGVGEKLHIFVGSKAPWVTIADDLPQIDGKPGA